MGEGRPVPLSSSHRGAPVPVSRGETEGGKTPKPRGARATRAPGVGHRSGGVAGLAPPKPRVSERTVDGSKPHNLGRSKLLERRFIAHQDCRKKKPFGPNGSGAFPLGEQTPRAVRAGRPSVAPKAKALARRPGGACAQGLHAGPQGPLPAPQVAAAFLSTQPRTEGSVMLSSPPHTHAYTHAPQSPHSLGSHRPDAERPPRLILR